MMLRIPNNDQVRAMGDINPNHCSHGSLRTLGYEPWGRGFGGLRGMRNRGRHGRYRRLVTAPVWLGTNTTTIEVPIQWPWSTTTLGMEHLSIPVKRHASTHTSDQVHDIMTQTHVSPTSSWDYKRGGRVSHKKKNEQNTDMGQVSHAKTLRLNPHTHNSLRLWPGTRSLSRSHLVTPTTSTSVQDNTNLHLTLDVGHSRPQPI